MHLCAGSSRENNRRHQEYSVLQDILLMNIGPKSTSILVVSCRSPIGSLSDGICYSCRPTDPRDCLFPTPSANYQGARKAEMKYETGFALQNKVLTSLTIGSLRIFQRQHSGRSFLPSERAAIARARIESRRGSQPQPHVDRPVGRIRDCTGFPGIFGRQRCGTRRDDAVCGIFGTMGALRD